MATHHAAPGEVVNLSRWTDDLPTEQSKAIAKTDEMELARLVLSDGEALKDHHVEGPLVVHCLSGCLDIHALGKEQALQGGELLYLPPSEQFSIKARERTEVLLTFVFVGNKPHTGG